MAVFMKDGLTLVPELMDKACLKSNVLSTPIFGREVISTMLVRLESVYDSVVDLDRISTPEREFIISRATLPSGAHVTITIVGTRDTDGWIAEVVMNHEPASAADEVSYHLSQHV